MVQKKTREKCGCEGRLIAAGKRRLCRVNFALAGMGFRRIGRHLVGVKMNARLARTVSYA